MTSSEEIPPVSPPEASSGPQAAPVRPPDEFLESTVQPAVRITETVVDARPADDAIVTEPVVWETPVTSFQANRRTVTSQVMVPAENRGFFAEAFEQAKELMKFQPLVVDIREPDLDGEPLPPMPEYLPEVDLGQGATPPKYGSPPMRDMAWSYEHVTKRLSEISGTMRKWQRSGRIE